MAGERRSPSPAADVSPAGIVGDFAGPAGGCVEPHLRLIEVRGLLTPQDCEAAMQRVVERQEVLPPVLSAGQGRAAADDPEGRQANAALPRSPGVATQPRGDRRTGDGDFQRALRSRAGPALPRGSAPARGRRPRARLRDSSCHRRWLDAGRVRAGLVRGLHAGCEGRARRRSRRCRSPTPRGALPSAHSGSRGTRDARRVLEIQSRGAPRLWSPPDRTGDRHPARCNAGLARSRRLGRAARELARRSGATLFSTLLAAFQIALSHWTGADDIVVGTPVANRSKQAVRETMGYLRGHRAAARPGRSRRVRSPPALRAVHQPTVDSFANAMPFAELVARPRRAPAPGHNPVFEVRFALQNHPVPDVALPGLSLEAADALDWHRPFRSRLRNHRGRRGLEVVWLFRPNLFPHAEIQNLGRLYLAVLASVCRSPEILTPPS